MAPILSKLMGKANALSAIRRKRLRFDPSIDSATAEPLVLILCPSRELAIQVFDEARRLSYRTMLRPCAIYGGGPMREQIADLSKGCDILVATPGRLKDLMSKRHILNMSRLRYDPRLVRPSDSSLTLDRFTVIDEADELVNPDWEEDLNEILMSACKQIIHC